MELHLTAILLNRTGDKRLFQSGLLVVSDLTNGAVFVGNNSLSQILKKDFERHGEYYTVTASGEKKAVFWYPNKMSSFLNAASGYYAHGEFRLVSQPLIFDPKLEDPVYVTESLQITNDKFQAAVCETLFLTKA